jgi:hypothetical protein
MFSKRTLTTAALAALVVAVGQVGLAKTITVQSISPNTTGSSPTISAGLFPGDAVYTYSVDLDPGSDVIAATDGFMVINFGTLDGYTLTNTNGSDSAVADSFVEHTQTTGTGLSGYQSNNGTSDSFSDTASSLTDTATPTDSSLINNAVFTYNGSSPYTSSSDLLLTLTLYTPDTSISKLGDSFGVDHSGANDPNPTLSFEEKFVQVPSSPAAVPLPSVSVLGGSMLGLLGLARLRKTSDLSRQS